MPYFSISLLKICKIENNLNRLCKPRALYPASDEDSASLWPLSLGSCLPFPRHLEMMGALLDCPRDWGHLCLVGGLRPALEIVLAEQAPVPGMPFMPP